MLTAINMSFIHISSDIAKLMQFDMHADATEIKSNVTRNRNSIHIIY